MCVSWKSLKLGVIRKGRPQKISQNYKIDHPLSLVCIDPTLPPPCGRPHLNSEDTEHDHLVMPMCVYLNTGQKQ